MKKTLILLASVMLVLGTMGFALAAGTGETPVTASVTVSDYKDVTVTACALAFGSANPGDINKEVTGCANPEDVLIENNAASNADIDISVRGTDFVGDVTAETFSITSLGWDNDNSASTTTAVTTTDAPVTSGLAPENSYSMYYFLDIPSGQEADDYSSTVTITTA